MESLIIQRISSILDHNKITKQNLANEINMNQTTLGRQLKGEQALSAKLIEGFLHVFPDISAEWLLRGEGEMYKSNSGSVQVEATITPPQNESPVSDYEPGYNLFITKDDKDKFYYVYLSYGPYNYANEEF